MIVNFYRITVTKLMLVREMKRDFYINVDALYILELFFLHLSETIHHNNKLVMILFKRN